MPRARNQQEERQFRYTRICFSFLAMVSSVFLIPIAIRVLFPEQFKLESFIGYLPIWFGIYVFLIWLLTVSWPLLLISSKSWIYRSGNILFTALIHVNIITIPFLLDGGFDQKELTFILSSNGLAIAYSLTFWRLHFWRWLMLRVEKSVQLRTAVFLSPIVLYLIYYGLFPKLSPELAYPYMTNDIQNSIFTEEMRHYAPGEFIKPLFEKYPNTRLNLSFSSEIGRYHWIQDDDVIYRLQIQNDTLLNFTRERIDD
jgi:hypothetical protein